MEKSVEVPQKITNVSIVRLSIATSLYAGDPWTTQIWTVQAHIYMKFFLNKYIENYSEIWDDLK